MNLRHLQFFIELAKTEHMAKAAETLGISQPSLSYAIKSLETELGVPLFEKDGRNIKLTNYGRIYLNYAEQSLAELNKGSEYIESLLNIDCGHINLGFTFTMGQDLVPRLVHEFKKNQMRNNISFSFKQGTTSELITNLINDEIDLVFASKPSFKQQTDQINIHHLVDQEIMAAVPFTCSLAKQKSVTLQELSNYPFILYSNNSGLRPDIDYLLSMNNIKPNIELESVEDHSIIGFVHWGYGVAIIPYLPQLAENQVKLLHLDSQKNWHSLYIITKSNHFLSPSVSSFLNFSQSYCKKNYLNKNRFI